MNKAELLVAQHNCMTDAGYFTLNRQDQDQAKSRSLCGCSGRNQCCLNEGLKETIIKSAVSALVTRRRSESLMEVVQLELLEVWCQSKLELIH